MYNNMLLYDCILLQYFAFDLDHIVYSQIYQACIICICMHIMIIYHF